MNPPFQKNKLKIQVHIGSKRVEKREVRNWEKEERDSMCARPRVCVCSVSFSMQVSLKRLKAYLQLYYVRYFKIKHSYDSYEAIRF
jgi:hypothetical protein